MSNISHSRVAIGIAGLALAMTGCGGSPVGGSGGSGDGDGPTKAEKFFKEMNGLPDQERRDKLVSLAQEEGELDFYTSMTSEVADPVAEAFTDEFDVDVNLYRAGSETVLQRILQEAGAGYAGNDVVETNATEMFALGDKEGLLADYVGDRRDLVPDTGRFEDWTATRFNLFAISWNTTKVKPGEEPQKWEDLADPKWDGKMSMELADYDWYLNLYGYWEKQGKSTEEIDKLFTDMAEGAKIVKGHTVQGELMSAGQFAVTASNYTYLVENLKRKGAPVDYTPLVEPVIARPNGLGLMKTADHPAAAMLFADWILDEGQQVMVDLGLTPAIPPTGSKDPLAGVEVLPYDVEAVLNESDEWSKKYDDLVSRGKLVDGE